MILEFLPLTHEIILDLLKGMKPEGIDFFNEYINKSF
jgi:hypothetical protein